jgi:hypothetical protein
MPDHLTPVKLVRTPHQPIPHFIHGRFPAYKPCLECGHPNYKYCPCPRSSYGPIDAEDILFMNLDDEPSVNTSCSVQ